MWVCIDTHKTYSHTSGLRSLWEISLCEDCLSRYGRRPTGQIATETLWLSTEKCVRIFCTLLHACDLCGCALCDMFEACTRTLLYRLFAIDIVYLYSYVRVHKRTPICTWKNVQKLCNYLNNIMEYNIIVCPFEQIYSIYIVYAHVLCTYFWNIT